MAPTETLAEQHFLTLEEPCRLLGVTCALLTSSTAKRERDLAPHADIVVGTHALIQEGVEFRDLAVAVVDEQHRFGVEQRKALTEGRSPHVLHMTATPIPRTLALTVYGDLAVSEIARPPADRKPITTAWVTEERSGGGRTARLRKHLDAGRQAYVVCPLIEESETTQARAAEAEAERLQKGELRGYRVGLLHGRLRPAERRELMARFKAGELDVLVATTVIEVGVDVPNATIMIVQEADRFGLAQLHQLRGRVGRGAEQSYCLLISRAREDLTEPAIERLEALVRTNDGFELAEVDLDIRGSGQLLGTRQSGLTDLHFAHLRKDRPLLERARALADELVDAEGPLSGRGRAGLRRAGTSPPPEPVSRNMNRREFVVGAVTLPVALRFAPEALAGGTPVALVTADTQSRVGGRRARHRQGAALHPTRRRTAQHRERLGERRRRLSHRAECRLAHRRTEARVRRVVAWLRRAALHRCRRRTADTRSSPIRARTKS